MPIDVSLAAILKSQVEVEYEIGHWLFRRRNRNQGGLFVDVYGHLCGLMPRSYEAGCHTGYNSCGVTPLESWQPRKFGVSQHRNLLHFQLCSAQIHHANSNSAKITLVNLFPFPRDIPFSPSVAARHVPTGGPPRGASTTLANHGRFLYPQCQPAGLFAHSSQACFLPICLHSAPSLPNFFGSLPFPPPGRNGVLSGN